MDIPRRNDGKCPKCAKQPRHVTSGGTQTPYCLDCLKNLHRVRRTSPLGRARNALYSQRSRARRLELAAA